MDIWIFPTFSPTVPIKCIFLLKKKILLPLGKILFQKLVKRTTLKKAWTHQSKKKGLVHSTIQGFSAQELQAQMSPLLEAIQSEFPIPTSLESALPCCYSGQHALHFTC